MLICKCLTICCTVCHHVAPQGVTQRSEWADYGANMTGTEGNGKENRLGAENDRNMQN